MVLFKDFDLKPGLMKAIEKAGYTEPTQIQSEVWEAAKTGQNIVGQSQTGTGKTTAFLLPLLEKADGRKRHPQVLIVAPTRELVEQIRADVMKLTEFYPMRSLVLMGGKKREWQREDLARGPQIIVATPGRLIEFIEEGFLKPELIEYFVLDEVDRMLDMGFIDDVDRIWDQLTNLKQTMTFSATINNEIKNIITKHCKDFINIKISATVTVDAIDHTYIDLPLADKFPTLMHLLDEHKGQKTIIFAQTKRNTETITNELKKHGYTAAYLNGDLDQRQRTRALDAFKKGLCKVLVTTDVAARGLNMDNVELVVNFEVPREPESYIHRIGRTGRAGATGKALMLVAPDEKHLLYEIEKTQNIKLVKSAAHESKADTTGEFGRVHLDKPLPPSDKKRRMMERRERGATGGRNWGNKFGGQRDSRGPSRSYDDRAPRTYAPRAEGSSTQRYQAPRTNEDRPARTYAPRAEGTTAPRTAEDRPARTYAPRVEGTASRPPMSDRAPRTYASRDGAGASPRRERPRRDASWTPRNFGNTVGGYDVDATREQRYFGESKFLGRKAADRAGREFDPHKGRPARTPRPGDSFIGADRPARSSGPRGPRTGSQGGRPPRGPRAA